MIQEFDPLKVLLNLLAPDPAQDEHFSLLSQMDTEQWSMLIDEVYQQSIAPLFYTLLVNLNNSHGFEIPQKEKLHQTHVSTAAKNMLILYETEMILVALQLAGIPAAGLKGIYLLENVYPDIGARSMSDVDLLVKKQDLPKCLAVMHELGYQANTYFSLADKNIDTKHVPPMEKSGSPLVEVHWTLLEEDEPFTINADALWERVVPAQIANVDALALGVEDLVLHLCLHMTYQHYLQLGLRGLLDIAMVIHKFQAQIDWGKLVEIAKSWGSEKVTALTLKLVETQLNVPIPPEVFSDLVAKGVNPDLLENARRQLLERIRFNDPFTPDLVEFSGQNTLFSKMKIGLRRIFIPRLALARVYNVPPNSPKIIRYYWIRLKYLVRSYGKTLLRLQRGEKKHRTRPP
jgi:hypothetical protein